MKRVAIKITPGMSFPIGAVCTRKLASMYPEDPALRHTLDHFLYWATYADRRQRAYLLAFTEADDGTIGWPELRVLRDVLLESKQHTDGRTWRAIRRRLDQIEDALDIDPVTRLAGRTTP